MIRRLINDRETKFLRAIINSYGDFEGKPALVSQIDGLLWEISETPEGCFFKILNGKPTDCNANVLEARYEDMDTVEEKARLREECMPRESLLWCVPHVCVLFHIGQTGKPIALEFFKEDSSALQKREPAETDLLDLGWI